MCVCVCVLGCEGVACTCTCILSLRILSTRVQFQDQNDIASLPPPPSPPACMQGYLYSMGPLPPETVRHYAVQLFEGLDHLHNTLGIIHCDIKREPLSHPPSLPPSSLSLSLPPSLPLSSVTAAIESILELWCSLHKCSLFKR